MTDALEVLLGSGSRWRREEARALHDEGVTLDRIAALFGVTRSGCRSCCASGPELPTGALRLACERAAERAAPAGPANRSGPQLVM